MLQYWRDSSISTTREHESFCEASEWQSADEIPTRDIEFPFNNGIPTYNKTNLFSVEHVHTSSDADARFVCEASNPWGIMRKNWGTRPDIANGTSKRVSYLGSMFSTPKKKKGGGGGVMSTWELRGKEIDLTNKWSVGNRGDRFVGNSLHCIRQAESTLTTRGETRKKSFNLTKHSQLAKGNGDCCYSAVLLHRILKLANT